MDTPKTDAFDRCECGVPFATHARTETGKLDHPVTVESARERILMGVTDDGRVLAFERAVRAECYLDFVGEREAFQAQIRERSREREQTLALLEALRRAKTWFESPSTDGARVGQYMAIEHAIAAYEAAHALQVAP